MVNGFIYGLIYFMTHDDICEHFEEFLLHTHMNNAWSMPREPRGFPLRTRLQDAERSLTEGATEEAHVERRVARPGP